MSQNTLSALRYQEALDWLTAHLLYNPGSHAAVLVHRDGDYLRRDWMEPLEDPRFNRARLSTRRIEFDNKSRISFYTMKDADSLRGPVFSIAVAEQPTLFTEAWNNLELAVRAKPAQLKVIRL